MDYGNENGRREGILLLITIKLDANVLLKWKNLTGDLLMKGTIISMRDICPLMYIKIIELIMEIGHRL